MLNTCRVPEQIHYIKFGGALTPHPLTLSKETQILLPKSFYCFITCFVGTCLLQHTQLVNTVVLLLYSSRAVHSITKTQK